MSRLSWVGLTLPEFAADGQRFGGSRTPGRDAACSAVVPCFPPTTFGIRVSTNCRSMRGPQLTSPASVAAPACIRILAPVLYGRRPDRYPLHQRARQSDDGADHLWPRWLSRRKRFGPLSGSANAPIEGGAASDGDRHVLVVQQGACKLYELYRAFPLSGGRWQVDAGAVYNLNNHALRPDTWTSADAAGLPILPGLVRYEEVAAGAIHHALRFTAQRTQRAYVWPARHYASSNTNPDVPPMGQRFRLRADFPVGDFSPAVQVILVALQQYGMILADNGSNWLSAARQMKGGTTICSWSELRERERL